MLLTGLSKEMSLPASQSSEQASISYSKCAGDHQGSTRIFKLENIDNHVSISLLSGDMDVTQKATNEFPSKEGKITGQNTYFDFTVDKLESPSWFTACHGEGP